MRTRLSILLVFVMVLTFVPLGPAGANGYWPISDDTTLTEDHYGQIKITANNITLDCDGYSVIGDGTGNGILLHDRKGVTIRNCHLSGFEHGIFLFAADNSVITNNQSNGNTGFGFLLMYSDSNTLYRNIAEGNGATGFDLGASNDNTLHHNQARGNLHSGFSFWLEASNNTMTFNLAEENVVDGFFVLPEASVGNTFSHNRAFRNGYVGIEDQTTGETGDGGTDDYYDHNVCVGNEGGDSYPTSLCLPYLAGQTIVNQGWRDDFASPTLDGRWSWVREDNTHWSLTEQPEFLRITTQQGGIYYRTNTNDARNILLAPATQPVFEISTKVSFSPTENFHQAGILVYEDDDNYVFLYRYLVNGDQRIRFYAEEDGTIDFQKDNGAFTELATTYFCRITKRGNLYIGEYSLDGTNWTEVHRVHAHLDNPSVGLMATSGGSTELPADFDFFEMRVAPLR